MPAQKRYEKYIIVPQLKFFEGCGGLIYNSIWWGRLWGSDGKQRFWAVRAMSGQEVSPALPDPPAPAPPAPAPACISSPKPAPALSALVAPVGKF